VFLVLLFGGVALAQGRRMPSPEQVEEVRKIVGEKDWGLMAEWRRRDVVHRYMRFLGAPAKKQESIRSMGLKQYLLATGRRRGPKLPEALQKEVDGLDERMRPDAHKLAYVRLRQMRLDRNLSMLPAAERRRWFKSLFPEPFDPRAARAARLEFQKAVGAAVAERLRPQVEKLSTLPEEERRPATAELVRRYTARQEKQLTEAVARSVRRLRGARRLPPDVELVLERREIFATPRQRELIRWALRPAQCPLLDFSWMGERPREKRARRAWDRDVAAIGRLELLSSAGFPREVVLHLSAASSDQDFVKGLRHLVGRPPPSDRTFGAER
jgi:hypothetical protein